MLSQEKGGFLYIYIETCCALGTSDFLYFFQHHQKIKCGLNLHKPEQLKIVMGIASSFSIHNFKSQEKANKKILKKLRHPG